MTNAENPYNWSYLKGSSSPQWFYNPSEKLWYAVTEDGLFIAPSVTQQPESQTVSAGSNVVLACEVDGAESYYWYKDNRLCFEGSNTLNLDATTASDSGEYFCLAINSVGEIVSETAVVTVESVTATNSENATKTDSDSSDTSDDALQTTLSDQESDDSTSSSVKTTLKTEEAQLLSNSESKEDDSQKQQNAAELDLSVF